MSDLKIYIVTLYRHEDLAEFYHDMETPGGNLFIPNREVDIAARRPKSRNTNYWLTEEEANQLRSDPRVADVVLEELNLKFRKPTYTQTSQFWNKQFVNNSNDINWGLLRVYEGQQRPNWGENSTNNQTGSITINAEGRNVDVLIVDGHFNPDHPEYAKNADGSGGSRVIQYNWYQHTNEITGGANGIYIYSPYTGSGIEDDNNHGAHVAGTVAGNRQGWARSANIYNISPYSSNPNTSAVTYLYDYIKEFHINKTVNPITGRKNPTIMNCSYGTSIQYNLGDLGKITRAIYRNVDTGTISAGLSSAQLNANGIYDRLNDTKPIVPYYSTADDADIQDLISLGVIIVAAAGNDYFYTCGEESLDYNNRFYATYFGTNYFWYYHRGSMPAASTNVISVGALGNTVNETKAVFSNNGPRVDIYAPGRAIMSSLNTSSTSDPRDNTFKIGKYQGTSMASPQVCGVLACALEIYPNMNQNQARTYLFNTAKYEQMTDTGGTFTDQTSLNGSINRTLGFRQERPIQGKTWPKLNNLGRPSTGMLFPRYRIKRL